VNLTITKEEQDNENDKGPASFGIMFAHEKEILEQKQSSDAKFLNKDLEDKTNKL
jgi:hypothetical protein